MCIIIAKNKIGRIPTESELRNSFEYNGDGAGFMYVDHGKVIIDKGYMNIDSFLKHYRSLLVKYNDFKNKCLVIHCRIGTSGKNDKGNTHPYPITDNVKALKSRHLFRENIGIAHNGIIHGYGTATGLNDTQEYISKYLYPLYYHYRDFYKNKDMLYQIKLATSSKFVILDKTDTLYFIGDFTEDKGLYFSNNSYKSWQERYSNYSYNYNYNYGYGKYNKYDYEDNYDDYDDTDDSWFLTKKKEQDTAEQLMLEDEKIKDELDDEEIEIKDEYYMEKLSSDWYIDMYKNGNYKQVGDKDYYYNYKTYELYEKIDGEYISVIDNPIIYNEKMEEIDIF